MLTSIVVILWFVAAVIALARPKWGAALIWPAIWLYPNSALYGTLPLNVRFDDLWVVFMFLLAVGYARGRGGGGTLLLLAAAWSFSMILGNLTGLFVTGGFDWQQVVKSSLKMLYVPMIVYILTAFIRDERDLVGHMKAMGLAATAAGALGIAMLYYPAEFNMFLIPRYQVIGFQVFSAEELVQAAEIVSRRAQGAVGTLYLAMLSMVVGLMMLSMMLYYPRQRLRAYFGVLAGCCMVTLGYTVMRGTIGGLIAAVLWAIVFTRRRAALVAVSLAGVAFLVIQGGLLERVLLRFTGEAGARMAPFMEGLAGRFAIWRMFVENFSPVYLLTGMGMSSVVRMAKGSAHSAYLGAFVYGGILGVVVMVAIVVRAWRIGRQLRMRLDPFSQGCGVFLTMVLIGLLVGGITNEIFQQVGSMQLLFASMVLAQKWLDMARVPGVLPDAGLLPAGPSPGYALAP